MSANEGGLVETNAVSDAEKQAGAEPIDKSTNEERLTGHKVVARNLSGMVEAKRDDASGSVAVPSFFVRADSKIKVEIDVLFRKDNGHILNIALHELRLDYSKLDYLGHSLEWFEFTQPKYDEIASYRQQSMVFNSRIGRLVVDPVKLRNFLIVFHLKGWSLRNPDGTPVPMEFEGGDAANPLSGHSLGLLDSMHPTLVDVVMSKFEVEILLQ
jgi:hypothetical protein